jgi:putative FmdB family regulatory protein
VPTYQYQCESEHEFEVFQSFSDAAIDTCPECGAKTRKVYSNVGVVFKGSGFYKTDSKKSDAKKSDSNKTEKKKSTETKSDS